jgi:hypothetical protein
MSCILPCTRMWVTTAPPKKPGQQDRPKQSGLRDRIEERTGQTGDSDRQVKIG